MMTGNPGMIHRCRANTAIHGTHAFVLQDADNRRHWQGLGPLCQTV
jgi:hypothetical protein